MDTNTNNFFSRIRKLGLRLNQLFNDTLLNTRELESNGQFHFSAPAATVVATINTPLKALGITTFDLVGALWFSKGGDGMSNRIKFIGKVPTRFRCNAAITLETASTTVEFTISLAKNGVVLAGSKVIETFATASAQQALSLSWLVDFAPEDYVEIWVENNTDDTNITIQAGTLTIS